MVVPLAKQFAGVKIRGGNIGPTAAQIAACAAGANGRVWSYMKKTWASSWPNVVKPQIDHIKALGGNCVRLIGDSYGVASGLFTQSYADACDRQFFQYCLSQGLYVEATAGGPPDYYVATSTLQSSDLIAMIAITTQYCKVASAFPNVFGCDVMQEVWGAVDSNFSVGISPLNVSTMLSLMASLNASIHAVAPRLPLTYSLHRQNYSSAMWADGQIANIAPLCDYINAHVYYTPYSVGDMAALYNQTGVSGKPILIGEHGVTLAAGSGRASAFSAQYALYAGTNVIGGNMWSVIDGGTVNSNQWGLYDVSDTPRSDIVAVYQAQTAVTKPISFPRKRRH